MRTHVIAPNAGRIITSLRDAGYDFNTAVADIVDNSISAGASNIVIAAVMSKRDGHIDVTIADDGCGMTPKEVLNAMRYGSDERIDEHTLGKFGLGLKTASTSQCRKVSLISRKSGTVAPFKLVLDIDHAQATNRWEYIEEQADQKDLQLLKRAADGKSGTVVRWEKCDRVLQRQYKKPGNRNHVAAFNKKVASLHFHLSIVFQRFLDRNDLRAPNISITLNGENVAPWDPFCTKLKGTEVVYSDEIIEDVYDIGETSFKVTAYVVPSRDELNIRQLDMVFPKGQTPDNFQGIYIYRENRLIHWGDWCDLCKKEFHFRLCRIELSFDAELDEIFSVDFKKSKITMDEKIGEFLLREVINPARVKADARYRGGSTAQHKREAKSIHSRANNDIGKRAAASRNYEVKKMPSGETEITTKRGESFIEPKPILKSETVGGVVSVEELPDNVLWQPRIAENPSALFQTSVEVNVSHPFYQKAFALCKDNPNAIKALDYLLWSLANAEYAAKDQKSLENFEDMRREVSRDLRQLAEELPVPRND